MAAVSLSTVVPTGMPRGCGRAPRKQRVHGPHVEVPEDDRVAGAGERAWARPRWIAGLLNFRFGDDRTRLMSVVRRCGVQ